MSLLPYCPRGELAWLQKPRGGGGEGGREEKGPDSGQTEAPMWQMLADSQRR